MVIIKWILLIVVLIKYSHGNPMDSQETDFPMLDIPLEIPIPRPLTTKCGISNQNGVGTEIKKNKDQAAFGNI